MKVKPAFDGDHGLYYDFAGAPSALAMYRRKLGAHASNELLGWLVFEFKAITLERQSLNALNLGRFLDRCQIYWNKKALLVN